VLIHTWNNLDLEAAGATYTAAQHTFDRGPLLIQAYPARPPLPSPPPPPQFSPCVPLLRGVLPQLCRPAATQALLSQSTSLRRSWRASRPGGGSSQLRNPCWPGCLPLGGLQQPAWDALPTVPSPMCTPYPIGGRDLQSCVVDLDPATRHKAALRPLGRYQLPCAALSPCRPPPS
jgi:hypothetical protein